MEIIELDLTGCTHQIDIQKRIKEAFDFLPVISTIITSLSYHA